MCFLGTKKNGIRDGDKKKVWDAGFSRKKSENKGTPPLPPPTHTLSDPASGLYTDITESKIKIYSTFGRSRNVKTLYVGKQGDDWKILHCSFISRELYFAK